MTKRSSFLACTALVAIAGTAAQAQTVSLPSGEVNRTTIETAFADYEYIDIRYGLTQVKVEAVDAETNRKVEAIYDKATGALLSSETEAAGDDAGQTGVVTRSLTRDFTDDGDDSTSDDDGIDDTTGGDDDSNDNTGSDDSTGGDDDSNDSSGGDDSGSDDSGSDDSGNDSSGGDDD